MTERIDVLCPKCGEDGDLLDTTAYGRTRQRFYCNVCGHEWTVEIVPQDISGNEITDP